MKPGLKKIDAIGAYEINHSMLLRKPSRPGTCKLKLERLRFANPSERLSHDSFDQLQDALAYLAVGLKPVFEVFSEFWVKDCRALGLLSDRLSPLCQGPSPGAMWQRTLA